MIQRIQTIFLALASAASFSLLALPFARSSKPASGVFSDQVYNIQDHVALMVAFLLGAVLSLGAIFLYQNRQAQMKLVRVAFVVLIIGLILAVVLFFNESKANEAMASVEVSAGLGLYVPILALVLKGLALRAINKDERTVRSIDRLR
jgi:hypothetical protein